MAAFTRAQETARAPGRQLHRGLGGSAVTSKGFFCPKGSLSREQLEAVTMVVALRDTFPTPSSDPFTTQHLPCRSPTPAQSPRRGPASPQGWT